MNDGLTRISGDREELEVDSFKQGQRWVSEMEPELGLGRVIRVMPRRVTIGFSLSDCFREYSIEEAPLKRFRMGVGEQITTADGEGLVVETVTERGGLLYYKSGNRCVCERELSDRLALSSPVEKLMAGWFDTSAALDLRHQVLSARHRYRSSEAFGFYGGRIELIAHQLYIAGEVSSRHCPRVLLCDETGLGKTVEACLILHRLLLAEQVGRVLILVPESLVHQWFVELYRRFNLSFRIVDGAYFRSVRSLEPKVNPFEQDQLFIVSSDFVRSDEEVRSRILKMNWDMLVVDEAHHLEVKGGYGEFAASLASEARGVMLLTATPEQSGIAAHFHHLNLLDPARYASLEAYQKEALGYTETARELAGLLEIHTEDSGDVIKEKNRRVDAMLDRHGPGRVVFRNTRKRIKGFPQRICYMHPLSEEGKSVADKDVMARLSGGEIQDCDLDNDPRIDWLSEWLRNHRDEKVLLISSSMATSLAIEKALSRRVRVPCAQFNESMTLLQRDRSAAWFSKNDGARLMICSEIGSEGRNFQFAHHLVLFDLPLNPELLEQRIGRLDRIGRNQPVRIHVPFSRNSAHEIQARWYHEGIGCFEKTVSGLHYLYRDLGPGLEGFLEQCIRGGEVEEDHLGEFLSESRRYADTLEKDFEKGRDWLLERNSFRKKPAEALIQVIKEADDAPDLENLVMALFDHYQVEIDPLEDRSWRIRPDEKDDKVLTVPGMSPGGMVVTFDRQQALYREDMTFVTWDHPMVTGLMELYMGTAQGICAQAELSGTREKDILLEAVFVLEIIAPERLRMDRFLPATPVRKVVSLKHGDVTWEYPQKHLSGVLKSPGGDTIGDSRDALRMILPNLLETAHEGANLTAGEIADDARQKITRVMTREIDRLEALRTVNPAVRQEEIDMAKDEFMALENALAGFRLRLDCLRLIHKT